MANPTLLTSPIAENGDKNVIPATTGATTGLLDQEHGFQQINELPLQAGGLPPQRKDFNGAFNLLSKILFYAQKGYIFEYDENQDYYAGCVVKDTDGGLYCANTDVSASSTHPKDDATNWALINFGFNKKETFTSSGSFTAPVTGVYKITLQGGGGGGASASAGGSDTGKRGGGGGGEGGRITFYEKLTAGTNYSYNIGAGGSGGVASDGGGGGTSSITINSNIYECTGGGGGFMSQTGLSVGGGGGTAKINSTDIIKMACGFPGGTPSGSQASCTGGVGGGGGEGIVMGSAGRSGTFGRGGNGGSALFNTYRDGGAGGNGYITFEYCDI